MSNESNKAAWSDQAIAILFLTTLASPLIGIVAGIIGLNNEATKNQGMTLLGTAILAGLFWLGQLS